MKTLQRVASIVFPMALISSLILFLLWQRKQQLPWEGFNRPDDVGAARLLLAKQFSGPGYFHFVEGDQTLSHPYISTGAAELQIPGILEARHLPPSAAGTISGIIGALAVRPSSRLSGTDHVNYLQLNLALDEMR